VLLALERTLAALWAGGMCAVGFVAVPALFSLLPDRSLAGSVAAQLFHTIAIAGTICGIGIALSMLRRLGSAEWRSWRFAVVVAMLCVTGLAQWFVVPAMEQAREAAGHVDDAFRLWHMLASAMFVANIVLGLLLVAAGPRVPRQARSL